MASIKIEPVHDKTNKMTCAPSDNSDQPGHRPSLIRAFNFKITLKTSDLKMQHLINPDKIFIIWKKKKKYTHLVHFKTTLKGHINNKLKP